MTVLELAILGLLKEQELHGYELKKRLADTLGAGGGVSVSYGSLYPALARLEAAGAVKAVQANGSGATIPGTGSLGGELAAFRARKAGARGIRGKKVYGITERGEQLFEELLATDSTSNDDERSFHLRLAFARYLRPDVRLGLLERRRAYLLERLDRTRKAVRGRLERLDSYTRSLMEHGNETTERDISWLDRLIARERETGLEARGDAAAQTGQGRDVPNAPDERLVADGERSLVESATITRAAASAPTMPARPAPRQEGSS
jgi:DNA-binding PadR family transcriptional regulator